jgi:hypothetical protein
MVLFLPHVRKLLAERSRLGFSEPQCLLNACQRLRLSCFSLLPDLITAGRLLPSPSFVKKLFGSVLSGKEKFVLIFGSRRVSRGGRMGEECNIS